MAQIYDYTVYGKVARYSKSMIHVMYMVYCMYSIAEYIAYGL